MNGYLTLKRQVSDVDSPLGAAIAEVGSISANSSNVIEKRPGGNRRSGVYTCQLIKRDRKEAWLQEPVPTALYIAQVYMFARFLSAQQNGMPFAKVALFGGVQAQASKSCVPNSPTVSIHACISRHAATSVFTALLLLPTRRLLRALLPCPRLPARSGSRSLYSSVLK